MQTAYASAVCNDCEQGADKGLMLQVSIQQTGDPEQPWEWSMIEHTCEFCGSENIEVLEVDLP